MTTSFEKRRAYHKAYRLANAEKIRARDKAYQLANAQKIRVQRAAYRRTHKEEIRVRDAAYLAAHREENRARSKARYRSHRDEARSYSAAYRLAHRAEILARHRAYHQEHLEEEHARALAYAKTPKGREIVRRSVAAYARTAAGLDQKRRSTQKRRALKLTQTPHDKMLTRQQWAKILEESKGRCCWCGKKCKPTMDHVIPLSKGGQHTADNIVVACGPCNFSKQDRIIDPTLTRALRKLVLCEPSTKLYFEVA